MQADIEREKQLERLCPQGEKETSSHMVDLLKLSAATQQGSRYTHHVLELCGQQARAIADGVEGIEDEVLVEGILELGDEEESKSLQAVGGQRDFQWVEEHVDDGRWLPRVLSSSDDSDFYLQQEVESVTDGAVLSAEPPGRSSLNLLRPPPRGQKACTYARSSILLYRTMEGEDFEDLTSSRESTSSWEVWRR